MRIEKCKDVDLLGVQKSAVDGSASLSRRETRALPRPRSIARPTSSSNCRLPIKCLSEVREAEEEEEEEARRRRQLPICRTKLGRGNEEGGWTGGGSFVSCFICLVQPRFCPTAAAAESAARSSFNGDDEEHLARL